MTEQQWRPIESAPKDGRRIIGLDVDRAYAAIVRKHGGEWECCDLKGSLLGYGFYPTHWMPLPALLAQDPSNRTE